MRGHWLWLVIFVLIVPILFESVNAEPPNGRVLVVQNYTPPTIDPSARRVPTRRNIQRCDMTAKLDLQSQTQKRSYDGYMYESVVRMVAMRDGLSSHKISARLTVKNIREEPVTFIFRWYDPEGRVIDESEFTRPDRSSYLARGPLDALPDCRRSRIQGHAPGKVHTRRRASAGGTACRAKLQFLSTGQRSRRCIAQPEVDHRNRVWSRTYVPRHCYDSCTCIILIFLQNLSTMQSGSSHTTALFRDFQ